MPSDGTKPSTDENQSSRSPRSGTILKRPAGSRRPTSRTRSPSRSTRSKVPCRLDTSPLSVNVCALGTAGTDGAPRLPEEHVERLPGAPAVEHIAGAQRELVGEGARQLFVDALEHDASIVPSSMSSERSAG